MGDRHDYSDAVMNITFHDLSLPGLTIVYEHSIQQDLGSPTLDHLALAPRLFRALPILLLLASFFLPIFIFVKFIKQSFYSDKSLLFPERPEQERDDVNTDLTGDHAWI